MKQHLDFTNTETLIYWHCANQASVDMVAMGHIGLSKTPAEHSAAAGRAAVEQWRKADDQEKMQYFHFVPEVQEMARRLHVPTEHEIEAEKIRKSLIVW